MLDQLVAIHGVSGDEQRIAAWLAQQLQPHVAHVENDRVGNLIAQKGTNPKVAIFVHMDTVGFMVKKVERGLVAVVPVGHPKHAHGARVILLTRTGEIEGVVIEKSPDGGKAIYIDTGLPTPESSVRIGDYATYSPRYAQTGDIVISRSLDNRLGCYIALEVVKRVRQAIFVGAAREEGGGSGARAAAYAVQPEVALVVDVTYDENIIEDYHIRIGQGPALCLKDDLLPSRRVADSLIELSQQRNIPLQLEVLAKGGSDAKAIFDVREGIPFAFIGIPIRYSHSPFEMCNLKDAENAIELVCAFIETA